MKRKNLRVINGKPLVAHTLEAALGSSRVDTVYLSSDDDEILEVGYSMGVEAFKRADEAASDVATADDVVRNFVGRLAPGLIESDPFIVYLQPTSPLRNAAHIDAAFQEMEDRKGSLAMSVVPLKRTPYKSFKLSPDGLLEPLFGEKLSNANRQALPSIYYPNGAIYIFPLSEFLKKDGFPSKGSVPFIMSEKESVDIDTEEDIALMGKP